MIHRLEPASLPDTEHATVMDVTVEALLLQLDARSREPDVELPST